MRTARTIPGSFLYAILAAAAATLAWTAPAHATFHQWKIDEAYSNASGSVQFVEFVLPSSVIDDERFVGGLSLTSNAHSYTFSTDLPSQPQANDHFLVATPGYAALTGVPAVDYVLATNSFFNSAGDTLTYAGGTDTLTFSAAQLPTNGTDSLNRGYGRSTFATAVNSPTNFSGDTGSLPEPTTASLLALAALGVLCLRRRPNVA